MRVLSVQADNLGSYKELEIDFTKDNSEAGLTLIQGPTGSGKSTLCDVVPWTLFGKTAKGGTVDEVLTWPGSATTSATVVVEIGPGPLLYITRTRKPNDLYFFEQGVVQRGKDLLDTQKILNTKLGLDYEFYLASSYYHEFSQTAQFFTATAKTRRQICEQLVDLTLAVKLKNNLKVEKQETTQTLSDIQSEMAGLKNSIAVWQKAETSEKDKAEGWEAQKQSRLQRLAQQHESFEKSRKRIEHNKCSACGTQLKEPKEIVNTAENPYSQQLIDIEEQKNPHSRSVKDFSKELTDARDQHALLATEELMAVQPYLDRVDELSDIVDRFRSISISNTITFLQTKTNQLLIDFFDAEIQVKFEVQDADKVEAIIYKDGNEASFTQLSKGQRQLLKLCFGVSVMQAVQNHHNIAADKLWFDESTDGLDDNMKLKALKMLQFIAQSYNGVYLVEHSESLKAMVNNKYSVALVHGESQLAKA